MTIIKHNKISKRIIFFATILSLFIFLTGCGSKEEDDTSIQTTEIIDTMTESTTEISTEEFTDATTEAPAEASTVTSTEALTEEISQEDTEASTDEVTGEGEKFEMVRGGYYYIPAGFDNITKDRYAVHYVQEWQNNSLDMYITVTDCMQIDIPVTIDEDYKNNKGNYESIAELSYDTKSEDRYIISGTKNDDQRIFYHSVRYVDDRYVSYYIEYPASNSETCNKLVEDFVANFNY